MLIEVLAKVSSSEVAKEFLRKLKEQEALRPDQDRINQSAKRTAADPRILT
jgi:hypothetical protein